MRTTAGTPALYDVVVGHIRHVAPGTTFRHRLYAWLVDVDELPRLPAWLRPFARFDSRDHLGSPERGIRENLDRWLATRGVDLHGGRVLMLTHARVLGFVFNPVSFFWCHRPDGTLECVVAEVHNTHGERHCYLLRPDTRGHAEADKAFYVSPFLPNSGHYEMEFAYPGEHVHVRIALHGQAPHGQALHGQDGPLLTAVLTGNRRAVTPGRVLSMLFRRPLVPHRVALLIRKHGIALWLRGSKPNPRQPHAHQEGTS